VAELKLNDAAMGVKDVAEPARFIQDPDQPEHWTLNFGPQHPATHTTIHLVLKLDGERIVEVTPHIGYLHSGFEKLAEHHTYDQYVTVTDRMNYLSPMANNIAWHHAVEKLLDIELTPRCKYARTIVAELSRIQDHLLNVGEAALEVGAFTAFIYCFNDREFIYDIFEALCGARFTTSWTRAGGAMADIPEGWCDMVMNFRKHLPKTMMELRKLLNRNRIFVERTKNVAVMSYEDAIDYSWSGPMARGSGIKRDLRKDEPYLAYPEIDFKIPIATDGDVFSRYLVRIEEIEQSLLIIEQAIKNLPDGDINVASDLRVPMAEKTETYGSIEGLIHHFESVMPNRGFHAPVNEIYACQETANGELGFFLVSDGTNKAWRAKTRGPSFVHLQSAAHLMCGHTISDVVVALASGNAIAAELDR
jgi:NADH-quinone oxidoreductase subunit D